MIKVGLKTVEIDGVPWLLSFIGCGHYHGCNKRQIFPELIRFEILKPVFYLKGDNNKMKFHVKLIDLIESVD